MLEPRLVGRTTGRTHAFFVPMYQIKSLIRYHHDMESYCARSDVKAPEAEHPPLTAPDLPPDALPEVPKLLAATNSQAGVSTHSVPLSKEDEKHWYALRTTYGRERKAHDYLVAHGVEAYLPLIKSVKQVDGKRMTVEESRIPNIFFARGTEDELKVFVYDNVNLPFLRFYYRHMSVGRQTVSVPLVVPDSQMSSLITICAADSADIVATPETIERFKEGQQVCITSGKFKGVTGIVARYQSQQRVGIIIEGLLTICTAYVPNAFLKHI